MYAETVVRSWSTASSCFLSLALCPARATRVGFNLSLLSANQKHTVQIYHFKTSNHKSSLHTHDMPKKHNLLSIPNWFSLVLERHLGIGWNNDTAHFMSGSGQLAGLQWLKENVRDGLTVLWSLTQSLNWKLWRQYCWESRITLV